MGYKLTWVYIGQTKVRPKGWTPWANTVAYWKFDSNLTDEMGEYDWTNRWSSTITYETLPWDASAKYMKITSWSDAWVQVPNTIWLEWGTQQTSFTWATFLKLTNNAFTIYIEGWGSWCVNQIGYGVQDWQNSLYLGTWNSGFQTNPYTYTLSTDVWHSVVWAYDHTTRTKSYYVDWVLIWNTTATNNYNTTSSLSKAILGRASNNLCISNMVLETNTVWDATTVQLFHNTFKSLYGLS